MADTVVDRTPPSVHLRIGEEKLTTGSGGIHGHVNPCTGKVDASIPLAGAAEVDRAVTVAHQAFGTWRKTRPSARRQLLLRLAELIEANAAALGRLGTLDNGMPN